MRLLIALTLLVVVNAAVDPVTLAIGSYSAVATTVNLVQCIAYLTGALRPTTSDNSLPPTNVLTAGRRYGLSVTDNEISWEYALLPEVKTLAPNTTWFAVHRDGITYWAVHVNGTGDSGNPSAITSDGEAPGSNTFVSVDAETISFSSHPVTMSNTLNLIGGAVGFRFHDGEMDTTGMYLGAINGIGSVGWISGAASESSLSLQSADSTSSTLNVTNPNSNSQHNWLYLNGNGQPGGRSGIVMCDGNSGGQGRMCWKMGMNENGELVVQYNNETDFTDELVNYDTHAYDGFTISKDQEFILTDMRTQNLRVYPSGLQPRYWSVPYVNSKGYIRLRFNVPYMERCHFWLDPNVEGGVYDKGAKTKGSAVAVGSATRVEALHDFGTGSTWVTHGGSDVRFNTVAGGIGEIRRQSGELSAIFPGARVTQQLGRAMTIVMVVNQRAVPSGNNLDIDPWFCWGRIANGNSMCVGQRIDSGVTKYAVMQMNTGNNPYTTAQSVTTGEDPGSSPNYNPGAGNVVLHLISFYPTYSISNNHPGSNANLNAGGSSGLSSSGLVFEWRFCYGGSCYGPASSNTNTMTQADLYDNTSNQQSEFGWGVIPSYGVPAAGNADGTDTGLLQAAAYNGVFCDIELNGMQRYLCNRFEDAGLSCGASMIPPDTEFLT